MNRLLLMVSRHFLSINKNEAFNVIRITSRQFLTGAVKVNVNEGSPSWIINDGYRYSELGNCAGVAY